MATTITNPWTGAPVEMDQTAVTEAQLDAWATLMDDDVRERLHYRLAPCQPGEFWAAYVAEVGPEAAGRIALGS